MVSNIIPGTDAGSCRGRVPAILLPPIIDVSINIYDENFKGTGVCQEFETISI